MQKEPHNLSSLFQRIFAGTATQKEKEQISGWLSKLDVSDHQLSDEEIEQRRLQFQKTFHERLDNSFTRRRRLRLSVWLPATAAVILLTIGLLFLKNTSTPPKIAFVEAATLSGERKIITLSDGTTITLNNASKLKFPQEFTGNRREVYLDGEAFFEVKHDAAKPFIVHTGLLKVNVLGTSFDVQNYAADHKIEVTVATGKVGVLAPGKDSRMLLPGQKLSYNPETKELQQSKVNPDDYTGWQQGDLIFRDESLAAICQQLERWYGVRIEIKSSTLKNKRISLEQKNESLQNVMKMLGMVGRFNYKITGKNVQISK